MASESTETLQQALLRAQAKREEAEASKAEAEASKYETEQQKLDEERKALERKNTQLHVIGAMGLQVGIGALAIIGAFWGFLLPLAKIQFIDESYKNSQIQEQLLKDKKVLKKKLAEATKKVAEANKLEQKARREALAIQSLRHSLNLNKVEKKLLYGKVQSYKKAEQSHKNQRIALGKQAKKICGSLSKIHQSVKKVSTNQNATLSKTGNVLLYDILKEILKIDKIMLSEFPKQCRPKGKYVF